MALYPTDMIQAITGKTADNKKEDFLLSDIQADILQNLDDVPKSAEKIKEQMLLYSGRDISIQEVMKQLINLSLSGWIKQIGNSYFMKA